jgi:geranylgeranyl diphosphate synthase type II
LNLRAYIDEKGALVDRALEEALPETDGLARTLVRSMRYSLFAGGKRLRPILCLAGCAAVGGRDEDAMPAAAALEMIHTYSLIHDDLPGMDDDDMRRGRPSNHKAFGEGMAILAGDGLLTLAFETIARAGRENRLDPFQALAALEVIADAAGFRGMVAGQAVDVESEGREASEDLVYYIHMHKTAALIAASVVSGAILGGGREDQVRALADYGRALGLAFQITDDILDIEGDSATIGKPAGSDQARGKITWPLAVGMDRAKAEAAAQVEAALTALTCFGPQADPLRAVAEYVLGRKK